jgi:hypothetical protein
MPYSVSGLPTTFSNELNYLGNTSWYPRHNDCYILGTTLSTRDHTSGSVYNKIFTPEIFINQGMCAAVPPTPSSADKLIFGIMQSPFNTLSLANQAIRGYTLFIKYGNEGQAYEQEVPNDNIRERPAIYNSAAFTGYIGVTTNGWTFSINRWHAFSMGIRDFGISPTLPGLTGCYTYYVINGESKNYGELIWRIQFSFGGTSGLVYDSSPVLWDGFSAWQDVTKAAGPSFWLNNDGCIQGPTYGLNPKYSSVNTQTVTNSSDGINDPRPAPIDYVQ